ncbi:DEAD/DEAH box helicase family protein [Salinigranum halophilum]|uniref:DEAD/DEAH box helicase family protein n=1 Tax=Salinigranum halophilum TaxID=2565931 RepID=UPI0010A78F1E|nr:DEAD/DEAH box helicase family protein [Salinigranum halophilum]
MGFEEHGWQSPDESSESDGNRITLRPYQQDAVESWLDNRKRGIFAMATGTGKTFTAIGAITKALVDSAGSTLVVIAVPYTHLVSQWDDSLREWGFNSIWDIYGTDNPSWRSDLSRLVSDLSIGVRDHAIVLTTHSTFSHEDFQTIVDRSECDSFLIADEVHGVGSKHYRSGLLECYQWRLGLSATPTRYYDETGTEYLLSYFGGIVYSYSLADAIPKYLTPYEYHPVIVELTDEELSAYKGLSTKIASELSKESPDEDRLTRLMNRRARIIKSAAGKLGALQEVLESIGERDHLLVYTNSQQMDEVKKVLNDQGIIHHKFTYHEDSEQRKELLEGFARGAYDTLVAMKCLDEGVDVPATKQAILMSSSSNPKQFIQRRGRVLRRADDIGKDKAVIYDFVVVPSTDPDRQLQSSERTILEKELRRFLEFADTAQNSVQAKNRIQPLCTAYEINLNEIREDITNA